MLSNLTGWHFIVILFIVLLLFGAPKLPALARSVGQSMKIFKSEIRSDPPAADSDDTPATPPTASTTPPSTTPPSGTAPADAPSAKPAP